MNGWLAAGSLAAVLALAGIARLLGLGGAPTLADEADAIAHAEALVSGFEGHAAILSSDRTNALVAAEPGDVIFLEPLGARFKARRVAEPQITENGAILECAGVQFPTGDANLVSRFLSRRT